MSATESRTLENVRIASPCKADWTKMAGDDRVRFCGSCEKYVYNVAGLSRDEATALIRGQGEVCVRLSQRADGTIITNDCPVGAKSVARTRRALAVIGGGLLAASALVLRNRVASAEEPAPKATTHVDEVTLAKKQDAKPGTDFWASLHEAVREKLRPEPRVLMGDIAEPEHVRMGAAVPIEPAPQPVRPR